MTGSIEGRLARARSFLGGLERISRVCLAQVANGASDLLVELLGATAGGRARFAVGAASLPFNVAVELAAVLEVS